MWLVEAGHVWRQKRRCPVPLSHLGCEFTRCRRRQLSASTFGRGRKSVWFEVVCGSPSCGSGGAHSSQWECASLEGDHRAGCCCLAIQQAGTLLESPQSLLFEIVLWIMAAGNNTGKQQATFSTPWNTPCSPAMRLKVKKSCFIIITPVIILISG